MINPPPTAQDWADLAKLPDWSGVWNPKITDQDAQIKTNPPPWNAKAARPWRRCSPRRRPAGRGRSSSLPARSHAEWMLVTHNAMEFLYTPGRVTCWAKSDGNRLRRIYTDGRRIPTIPIRRSTAIRSATGRATRWWSTPSVFCPQAFIAVSEAAGVPNNGDMHIVERIHLPARRTA